MTHLIIPLVLCGNSGTLFQPASNVSQPVQLLAEGSTYSPLQLALIRSRNSLFDPRPIILGSNADRLTISQQVHDIEVPADIILEPVEHNPCAAIAAGCYQALRRDPQAVMMLLDTERFMPNASSLAIAAMEGLSNAELGLLVAFGAKPTRPEVGYAYISPGPKLFGSAYGVQSYLDKPDIATAERCIANGWYWSSGNLLFQAATFIQDLSRLEPGILPAVRSAFDSATSEAPFLRLDAQALAAAPQSTLERTVLERTARAAMLKLSNNWPEINARQGHTPKGVQNSAREVSLATAAPPSTQQD